MKLNEWWNDLCEFVSVLAIAIKSADDQEGGRYTNRTENDNGNSFSIEYFLKIPFRLCQCWGFYIMFLFLEILNYSLNSKTVDKYAIKYPICFDELTYVIVLCHY